MPTKRVTLIRRFLKSLLEQVVEIHPGFKHFNYWVYRLYLQTTETFMYKKVLLNEETKNLFKRKLSPEQLTINITLLTTVLAALKKDYTLAFGSLIGAVFYNGMVPWDDDIDLFCRYRDYDEIKSTYLSHPDLDWQDCRNGRMFWSKVFFKSAQNSDNIYPFIDIFWLIEEDEEIFSDSVDFLRYKKSDIFPSISIPFEGLTLQCPRNARRIIEQRYPTALKYARPSTFDHLNNQPNQNFKRYHLPLTELAKLYPILNKTVAELKNSHIK